MKQYYLYFFLFIFLTGCMQSYYYPLAEPLTKIPTKPHKEKVEVYFSGEKVEPEYLKIEVLEVRSAGGKSFQELVNELKSQAQHQGMDGIIVLNKSEYAYDESEYSSSVYVSSLAALGIKFIQNINYLDDFVKSIEVKKYNPTENSWKEAATIQYDINSTITDMTGEWQHFIDFYYDYSLDHLIEEKSNAWKYKTDMEGRLIKRNYYWNGGDPLKKCKFLYSENGELARIKIHYPDDVNPRHEIVHLFYDLEKRVAEKVVYQEKQPFLRETTTYDQGKIINKTIFKLDQGKETPFLSLDFKYYTNDYLPTLLSQANN